MVAGRAGLARPTRPARPAAARARSHRVCRPPSEKAHAGSRRPLGPHQAPTPRSSQTSAPRGKSNKSRPSATTFRASAAARGLGARAHAAGLALESHPSSTLGGGGVVWCGRENCPLLHSEPAVQANNEYLAFDPARDPCPLHMGLSGRGVCRYFRGAGVSTFRGQNEFRPSSAGRGSRSGGECYDFTDRGYCRFGADCRFEHLGEGRS